MKNLFLVLAVGLVYSAFGAEPAAVPSTPAKDTAAIVGASYTASAQASIAKAAAYLAQHQKSKGNFSNPRFPGLSGLALWALIGANDKQYEPVIEKGVDYLLSTVQKDGGIYCPVPGREGGGLSTYNTAVCLTALSFVKGRDLTRVILDARTFLAGSQLSGDDSFSGGFGYDKASPNRYADLMNTHFVMEAMRRTEKYEDKRPVSEKKADLDWDAALAFVERLQNDEDAGDSAGGLSYSPADAKAGTETVQTKADGQTENDGTALEQGKEKVIMRSYGSITYAGLLALVYCKLDRTDSRVRSALDWASKHWTLEENPGVGDQGLYFFYDVIGRSLSVSGIECIERSANEPSIDWRAELVKKLVSLQRENGSYQNSNSRFWENDPILSTAYSAIALEFAIRQLQ
ncbi:MAG: hypothetical protein ACI4QT_01360 [Kiritimatiellia bacterium]